jgi:two-component system CheB/CheR fusion protein
MVLARVMGEDAFRERVKIYATDVDEEELDFARHGAYLPRQIEDVPHDALDRFFERTDQRYVFRKDLRRSVIFGRNDLVQDAPISHIDLLVCRNTLMYFNAETQAQILRRFHFALDDDGMLLLGKSEMLIAHSSLFTPVDLKRRIFRKVIKPSLRDRVRAMAFDPVNGASQTVADTLREAAFDIGAPAQLVLDVNAVLVMANDAARRMFGLGVGDYGRPVQDLELSYRPIELRGHLDAVARDLRGAEIKAVRWRSADTERILDIRVTPLLGDSALLGTSIAYTDVTEAHHLQEQLAGSRRDLEQAYEELQSTVEELETTNEELQSTNEELETMNEELQSSNEELETMNEELRHRTAELHELNAFLEAILSRIGMAVAVIDRSQHVQVWNGKARELFGVSTEEAEDQHVMSLDIGLPLVELRSRITAALGGRSEREEVTVEAVNRRGKPFQCRVTLLPLGPQRDDGYGGLIMMMEPVGEAPSR